VLRIRPGATRTVESGRLIHASQRRRAFDRDVLLDQVLADGLQRPPAACRMMVGMNGCSIGHRKFPSAKDE
jgi:hypothetical protein